MPGAGISTVQQVQATTTKSVVVVHDEDAADIYAPSLPDCIYRLALDWVGDLDEEEEQRAELRKIAMRLRLVGRSDEDTIS